MARKHPSIAVFALTIASCRPASAPQSSLPRYPSMGRAATRVDRDASFAAADAAQESIDDPLARWPTMPAQRAAWNAPDESPFSQSVRWLFDHGMPDPRELEYVRARVTVGGLWDARGQSVEAHGWLYRAPDNAQWFLGWNGNLYEPEAVLGPADFDADYAQLTTTTDGGFVFDPVAPARGSEAATLAPSITRPITNAILARLGKRTAPEVTEHPDVFVELVSDYQGTLFERAVCAHRRGDDRTTLRVATRLVSLREATRRFARSSDAGGPERSEDPFAFATSADGLRTEARRRVVRGTRAAVITATHDASAGPAGSAPTSETTALQQTAQAIEARVRSLVDELDEVDEPQGGQPGGVSLTSDPRVSALIELGEPAIPLLIDTLDRDERLTRSVEFRRDIFRHRNVLPVRRAAYAAIEEILCRDFLRDDATGTEYPQRGPEALAALVARVRAHWAQLRATPAHERALRALADDRATAAQWAAAAHTIVTAQRGTNATGAWMGEPLRAQRGPSITERFVQRVEQVLAAFVHRDDAIALERRQSACAITRAAIAWEPSAPTLRTLTERWTAQTTSDSTAAWCAAQLFFARDQARDPTALGEYARWLSGVPFNRVERTLGDVLVLARRQHLDPQIQRAFSRLLSPSGWIGDGRDPHRIVAVLRGMLDLAPARQYAIRRLSDRTPIGRLEIHDGTFAIRYRTGASITAQLVDPARDGAYEWRMCDELVFRLAGALPTIGYARGLIGPVRSRRAAVEAFTAALRRWRDAQSPR